MPSPSPLALTVTVNTSGLPSAQVAVTFANVPNPFYFSASDFTTHGIVSVDAPVYNATQGTFTVHFQTPSSLKPAVYTDTVTLLLCSDPQCKVVIANQPLTVNYTVTAAMGASAPRVTLDSTTLGYQVLYIEQYPVTVTPDPTAFTFSNFAVTPFVKLSAPTTGGIDTLAFSMTDATHGGITFTFANPSTLAHNTYTTPVNVTVCLDPNCVNPVAGGSFALTVQYVIGSTVTIGGANGYTMSVFPVPAVALAGNAAQSLIYASITSSASSNASTIEALDPSSGTGTFSSALLGGRTVLALSDDGQYLYVPSGSGVEQVLTSTLTPDLSIAVTAGSEVAAIAVAPGKPQTIAVGGYGFLQVFDGAIARPNSLLLGPTTGVFSLQWGSTDSDLYGGYGGGGGPISECNFAVDAGGVSGPGTCIHADLDALNFANGEGYAFGGAIYDPTNWTVVGQLSDPHSTVNSVLPDATVGKAFTFAVPTNGVGCEIETFDLATLAPIAIARLPTVNWFAVNGQCSYASVYSNNNVVRWGANGIALATGTSGPLGYVITISGPFVGP
jgi:hypothetical protein